MPELPPPVGTWQHYDFDPRAKWPWTAWDRHAEGTYLVSAGGTYQAGKGYGANTHAITEAESSWKRAKDESSGWCLMKGNEGFVNRVVVAQGSDAPYTGKPHNNMPQSIAVPLWHRTA